LPVLRAVFRDRPGPRSRLGDRQTTAQRFLSGEGEVVHLVAHRVTDLSNALASVGSRDTNFPLPHGRGDEVRHSNPSLDPLSLPPKGLEAHGVPIHDLHIDTIKVKTRDFQ
jgi:error-prone DNA polymerase